MIIINPLAFILLCFLPFLNPFADDNPSKKQKIRFLPLGDSYTICDGAKYSECWTEILTVNLHKKGVQVEILTNPARSGFTTTDLIERELPMLEIYRPEFITLCIGVNDWVQEVPADSFRLNYTRILDSIQAILPNKENLIILTIPDFSVKPEGKKYGRGRDISKGLAGFNEIIMQEAEKRNLRVVDLFQLSQEMKYDKQSIAEDGLHPSAKEYAIWEKLIFPHALEILSKK
jgi:acyl-CoA thioesterase I